MDYVPYIRTSAALKRAKLSPEEISTIQARAQAGKFLNDLDPHNLNSERSSIAEGLTSIPGLENDDELQSLDEEIGALEASNAQMESEMVQLREEISGMESRIQQHEQENQNLETKTQDLQQQLSQLRTALIHCLQSVPHLPNRPAELNEENLDDYLTQLQGLFTGANIEIKEGQDQGVFAAIKQAVAGIQF